MTAGAFARVVRRAAADRGVAAERCELCGAGVPAEHGHLLDTETSEARCVCRACRLLFERDGAGHGRYLALPRRRVRLTALDVRALGVPVGLAYVVLGADGAVRAHYPSPVGATRWDVDRGAWEATVAGSPLLATLRPEVEALLVRSALDAEHRWIVPVDDCFRLVAIVRARWRGLSGGTAVWPAVEEFFTDIARKESAHG